MRKVLTSVLLVLFLSTTSSCAWYQRLRNDPVMALQEGVGYIGTALNMARSAFEIYASTSGDENVGATRARFNEVTGSVDRGLMVAQSGLRVAAATRSESPDVTVLLVEAQTAIRAVHDFLVGLPGNGPGRAANPLMAEAIAATERASLPY